MDVTSSRDTAADGRRRGTVPERRDFLRARHGVANVLHILVEHALLIGWLVLAPWYLPWFVFIPLSIVACLIHQRAMSEWVHEGAHYNLVANRRWNDALTDVLAGVWFLMPVKVYRATHFAHHAKAGYFVPDDPDTEFLDVESRGQFRRAIAADLTGMTILKQFRRFGEKSPRNEWRWRVGALAVHLSLLALTFWLGLLYAPIIYYATLATFYPLLNRLRVYVQHVTLESDGTSRFRNSPTSRTTLGPFWDRILHTSPRLMYHHEHHAFPHLPYRALRGLVVPTNDVNRLTRRRWATLRRVYRGLPADG